MDRKTFITPAMSILLDAVRAAAALLVLGGHAVQTKLYIGAYPFDPMTQHYAVIVFFVLSGLVIAHSVQSREYSLRNYAIARVSRIVPVAWFALGFAVVVFLTIGAFGKSPGFELGQFNHLDPRTFLLPLLFLSETGAGGGPVWNPPYWSLVYEVWFYAIFCAAVFLTGRIRWLTVVLVCLIAGWRILLMMPIWLMGVALEKYGDRIPAKGWHAAGLTVTGAACLYAATNLASPLHDAMYVLFADLGNPLRWSEYFVTDTVFGLGIAIAFILLRPIADRNYAALQAVAGPIRCIAGFSFSLYALHWPMLLVRASFGITAGTSPLAFAALLGGIIGVCALLAQAIELRNRDVRRWLDRKLVVPGRTPATA